MYRERGENIGRRIWGGGGQVELKVITFNATKETGSHASNPPSSSLFLLPPSSSLFLLPFSSPLHPSIPLPHSTDVYLYTLQGVLNNESLYHYDYEYGKFMSFPGFVLGNFFGHTQIRFNHFGDQNSLIWFSLPFRLKSLYELGVLINI